MGHATMIEMLTSFTRICEFMADQQTDRYEKAGKISAEISKASGQLDLATIHLDPMEYTAPRIRTIQGMFYPHPRVVISEEMYDMIRSGLSAIHVHGN